MLIVRISGCIEKKGEGMHRSLLRVLFLFLIATVPVLFAAERVVVCETIVEET